MAALGRPAAAVARRPPLRPRRGQRARLPRHRAAARLPDARLLARRAARAGGRARRAGSRSCRCGCAAPSRCVGVRRRGRRRRGLGVRPGRRSPRTAWRRPCAPTPGTSSASLLAADARRAARRRARDRLRGRATARRRPRTRRLAGARRARRDRRWRSPAADRPRDRRGRHRRPDLQGLERSSPTRTPRRRPTRRTA